MKPTASQSEPVRAFVDRIEGGVAVIVLSDGSGLHLDLPLKYLPPETSSGAHLLINIQTDPAGQQATKQSVAELQRELTANNDAQQKNFKL